MDDKLHLTQLEVKKIVALNANDREEDPCVKLRMARPKRETEPKIRLHFIPEWAEARGFTQADIVRQIDADKSNVSRWWGGAIPRDEHLEALVQLFGLETPQDLFRHPDDDWLRRFFGNRSQEELERARAILEAAFPDKAANSN